MGYFVGIFLCFAAFYNLQELATAALKFQNGLIMNYSPSITSYLDHLILVWVEFLKFLGQT